MISYEQLLGNLQNRILTADQRAGIAAAVNAINASNPPADKQYTDGQLSGKADTGHNHDHGTLTGRADDDHIQYHNNTRGDARYYTQTNIDTYKKVKYAYGRAYSSNWASGPATVNLSNGTISGQSGEYHGDYGVFSEAPAVIVAVRGVTINDGGSYIACYFTSLSSSSFNIVVSLSGIAGTTDIAWIAVGR